MLLAGSAQETHWSPHELPSWTIPDTRAVGGVRIEGRHAQQLTHLLGARLPAEGAACLWVHLVAERATLVVHVDSVTPADLLWATPDSLRFRCPERPEVRGTAHSHTFATCGPIAAATVENDVLQLLNRPRYWLMLIWCFDGTYVVLWQGGQRSYGRYFPRRQYWSP